jgi:Zn-dependent protease
MDRPERDSLPPSNSPRIMIHWTSWILIFWLGLTSIFGQGEFGLFHSMQLVLVFAISVLVHALSHGVACRSTSARIATYRLTPLGDAIDWETEPTHPREAIKIAIAGPLTSGLIAAALGFLWYLHGQDVDAPNRSLFSESIVAQIFYVNAMLALVNLVPVFPFDASRVLRARMQFFYPDAIAAMKIGRWGIAVAVLLFVASFFTSWLAFFASIFVFIESLKMQSNAFLNQWLERMQSENGSDVMGANHPNNFEVSINWVSIGPAAGSQGGHYRSVDPTAKIIEASEVRRLEE